MLYDNEPKASLDFETRSACNLKKHGAWIYSKDPTTSILCARWHLPIYPIEKKYVGLYNPAFPEAAIEETSPPEELFEHILSGGLVEAHNAFFERSIWRNVCVERLGWPDIPDDQWRCSLAKASACSLPRGLEGGLIAIGSPVEKDMDGRRIMLKVSKPRKPRKAEVEAWTEQHGDAEMPVLWNNDREDLLKTFDYCGGDVIGEAVQSHHTPDLPPKELALWQIDQRINWEGVRLDPDLARAALKKAAQWKKKLNRELFEMTGIEAGTRRVQIRDWLNENEGLNMADTKAATLDHYLEGDDISGRARRVIEIMKTVNKTSLRKWNSMIDRADPDDKRARDLLMYHGAGTGRFSGKGLQPQNFPRGNIGPNKWFFDEDKGEWLSWFDMDLGCQHVLEDDIEWLEVQYGDPMELLSATLRGGIMASPGRDLISADYSAIEARVVLWLSGAVEALNVFYEGGDIYCDMATGIYGYLVEKKTHPDERQFGKQAILGLGYSMGFVKFFMTCRGYGLHFSVADCRRIMGDRFNGYHQWVKDYLNPVAPKPTDKGNYDENLEKYRNAYKTARKIKKDLAEIREVPAKVYHELALMKYTVDVYRRRYAEVKALWYAQEGAAIDAVSQWQKLVRDEFGDELLLGDLEETDLIKPSTELPWDVVRRRDSVAGPRVEAGKCAFYVYGGFLCCELPSGRCIRYRDPRVRGELTSWGEKKPGLSYMNLVTGGKWARTGTYGGKIVENETQAVARDIMSDAMLRAYGYDGFERLSNGIIKIKWGERTPYDVMMSVHDELVAEMPALQYHGLSKAESKALKKDVCEDFESVMATLSPWAGGCPVTAEAEIYKRFRK